MQSHGDISATYRFWCCSHSLSTTFSVTIQSWQVRPQTSLKQPSMPLQLTINIINFLLKFIFIEQENQQRQLFFSWINIVVHCTVISECSSRQLWPTFVVSIDVGGGVWSKLHICWVAWSGRNVGWLSFWDRSSACGKSMCFVGCIWSATWGYSSVCLNVTALACCSSSSCALRKHTFITWKIVIYQHR